MTKVVIFIGDGVVQGILADSWFTEVLVLDKDLEGVEKGDPGLKVFDGETYYVGQGVDLVDPQYVEEIFQAMVEAEDQGCLVCLRSDRIEQETG
jgi:hypothetical protein